MQSDEALVELDKFFEIRPVFRMETKLESFMAKEQGH